MSDLTGATPQSLATLCAKLLTPFTLAALTVQNTVAEQLDETTAYEGAAPPSKAGPRVWMSYERLMLDEEAAALATASRTKVVREAAPAVCPITAAKEARYALAAFMAAGATAIVATPTAINAATTSALVSQPEAAPLRLMEAAVMQHRSQLSVSPLSHDHSSIQSVRRALDLLIGARTGAKTPALARAAAIRFAPIADKIARLFVDFMKCIAWNCAVLAFERGCSERQLAWPLNLKALRTILSLLGDSGQVKKYVCAHAAAYSVPKAVATEAAPSNAEAEAKVEASSEDDADGDAESGSEEDDVNDDDDIDALPATAAGSAMHNRITVLEYDA